VILAAAALLRAYPLGMLGTWSRGAIGAQADISWPHAQSDAP